MAMEGIRGFIQMAAGLGELTVNKAAEGAQAVLGVSGGLPNNISGQASALAEELLAAAVANRKSLLQLVRSEVDQALNLASGVPHLEIATIQTALTKALSDLDAIKTQLFSSPVGRVTADRFGVLEASLATAKGAAERLGFIDDSVAAARGTAQRLGLFEGAVTEMEAPPESHEDQLAPIPTAPRRPSRAAIKAASGAKNAPAKKAVVHKRAAKAAAAADDAPAAPAAAPAAKKVAKKAVKKAADKAAAPAKPRPTTAAKAVSEKAAPAKAVSEKAAPAPKAAKKAAPAKSGAPARTRKAAAPKAPSAPVEPAAAVADDAPVEVVAPLAESVTLNPASVTSEVVESPVAEASAGPDAPAGDASAE